MWNMENEIWRMNVANKVKVFVLQLAAAACSRLFLAIARQTVRLFFFDSTEMGRINPIRSIEVSIDTNVEQCLQVGTV
jgi:hypothetical protein